MVSRVFTVLVVLGSALTVGCGARQESTQTEQRVSTTERVEYEATAEHRLAELGARIDSLKYKVDVAGAETKAELKQQLDELEIKRQEAARKLGELKAAGEEGWDTMRREMADVLDDLEQKFDRIRNGNKS